MPLNEFQKIDIRRHLGFPVAGLPLISPAGGTLASGNAGYRFLQVYGQLEFRMNNLNVPEEALITGAATGGVALFGGAVTVGMVFQLQISGTFTGSPVTVSYTSVLGDGQPSVIAQLVNLINQNATLQAAGFVAQNPYGFGPFSQNSAPTLYQPGGVSTGNASIPINQLSIINTNPAVTAFTLTPTTTGGGCALVVTMQGQQPTLSATVSRLTNPATVLFGFLPILAWLEGEQAGTTMNLAVAQAGKNGELITKVNEIELREQLYSKWVGKLWLFLLGDGRESQGRGSGGGSLSVC